MALRRHDAPTAGVAIGRAVDLANSSLCSLPSEDDRRQWAQQSRSAYADAVEWKLQQGDATGALDLWEWYRGAEHDALDDGSAPQVAGAISASSDVHQPRGLPEPIVVSSHLRSLAAETVLAYGSFPTELPSGCTTIAESLRTGCQRRRRRYRR